MVGVENAWHGSHTAAAARNIGALSLVHALTRKMLVVRYPFQQQYFEVEKRELIN
jgi:hypothetical protein